jgi:putative PIN family toxin of toxin-antitoxin system
LLRVILDTNVLISLALAQRGPLLDLREAWQAGHFSVLVSAELLKEVREVIERPKITARLSKERRDGLLLRHRHGGYWRF